MHFQSTQSTRPLTAMLRFRCNNVLYVREVTDEA